MSLPVFDLKTPPQRTPYSDHPANPGSPKPSILNDSGSAFGTAKSRIFNLLWWKFFQDIVSNINTLWTEVQSLIPGTTNSYVTDGVTTTDTGTVLSGGTSSLVSPVATPSEGDLWTAFLTQPAAGNELVDLTGITPNVNGLSVNGAGTINNVSRGGSKITALSFVCRYDGEWWLTSVMVLS